MLTHIGWSIQKRESNATRGQNKSQKKATLVILKLASSCFRRQNLQLKNVAAVAEPPGQR